MFANWTTKCLLHLPMCYICKHIVQFLFTLHLSFYTHKINIKPMIKYCPYFWPWEEGKCLSLIIFQSPYPIYPHFVWILSEAYTSWWLRHSFWKFLFTLTQVPTLGFRCGSTMWIVLQLGIMFNWSKYDLHLNCCKAAKLPANKHRHLDSALNYTCPQCICMLGSRVKGLWRGYILLSYEPSVL
jgi:hypothetical protein